METIHNRIRKLNKKPLINEYNHDLCSFSTFHNYSETNKILGCLDICNNSALTKYPISIYNEDGSIYTNMMCRECIISSLQYATNVYFKNGIIDEDKLDNIYSKPKIIPTIECKPTDDNQYHRPQIPLDQLIKALIKDDKDLSSLISAWLNKISYFVQIILKLYLILKNIIILLHVPTKDVIMHFVLIAINGIIHQINVKH